MTILFGNQIKTIKLKQSNINKQTNINIKKQTNIVEPDF